MPPAGRPDRRSVCRRLRTSEEIAAQIVDQGADYVLALKGNQGTLEQEVKLFFEDAREISFRGIPHSFHQSIEGDHGRVETRRTWAVSDLDWLAVREVPSPAYEDQCAGP